ncbi:Imm1 family immunity protein [Actinokineospora cianjurensis]|uniref:Immunity protein Imm1 of predicted polymorphic toxin system n=1 Tax=Actinokineospora cianjurensis TaxID=585224 RepID=A0A421B761_9PSEU|nr:Imm1 family immunity protein [Actinokineospora cianjurensis]RLK60311.1 immunity protein Imm1 of predicted polymorphic toxin system [Actinokineospora cianjurensis]
MSFRAAWEICDPQELPADGTLVAHTPDDVDRLVALLSDPRADPAMVFHLDRPSVISEFSGKSVPDHLLWALVHRGFGYLSHYCPTHPFSLPIGDPTSPARHYDHTDFEAGTGLALDLFTHALKEFLATAARPTCVRWRQL